MRASGAGHNEGRGACECAVEYDCISIDLGSRSLALCRGRGCDVRLLPMLVSCRTTIELNVIVRGSVQFYALDLWVSVGMVFEWAFIL